VASEADLKELLISAVVGLAVLYAVDSYWFHGKYFAATSSMSSHIASRFQ
jgi:hypothetical protein